MPLTTSGLGRGTKAKHAAMVDKSAASMISLNIRGAPTPALELTMIALSFRGPSPRGGRPVEEPEPISHLNNVRIFNLPIGPTGHNFEQIAVGTDGRVTSARNSAPVSLSRSTV